MNVNESGCVETKELKVTMEYRAWKTYTIQVPVDEPEDNRELVETYAISKEPEDAKIVREHCDECQLVGLTFNKPYEIVFGWDSEDEEE